ncbi:MAG TPA: PRC-barrel domain-containing protein [Methyloceanibacter sp.]
MNRLLTTTAIGLMLGLAPALAETQVPSNDNTPALEQPATPSEAIPANPADPTNPDKATQVPPEIMAPVPGAEPLPRSSEIEKSPVPDASTAEAPKSLAPDQSASAAPAASPFLVKQDASDLLVANLIGQSVLDANNQSIGEVTDLITDKDGKVVALLIGAGGFLGLGEKDVAIRFEDVKISRDENNDLSVMAKVSNDQIAAAPDYETLDEQQMIVGEKDINQ